MHQAMFTQKHIRNLLCQLRCVDAGPGFFSANVWRFSPGTKGTQEKERRTVGLRWIDVLKNPIPKLGDEKKITLCKVKMAIETEPFEDVFPVEMF